MSFDTNYVAVDESDDEQLLSEMYLRIAHEYGSNRLSGSNIDGEAFVDVDASVSVVHDERVESPVVTLLTQIEDGAYLDAKADHTLTPDEAEALAEELLDAAGQAREANE